MERIIEIKGLSVMVHLGVPDEERATTQRLLFDLRFAAKEQPANLLEDLSQTIDYAFLCQHVQKICVERPRLLLETLADDITNTLFEKFPLSWIELTVKKFILPNTEYVAIHVRKDNLKEL